MEQDIRWKQRFEHFGNALNQLGKAVNEVKNPTDLEKEGTIQRFEFTHELAWKVMKDYLEYEGIMGSRSATREAFNKGLITDGQVWMDMIESRNGTVHTYLAEVLEREYTQITLHYYPLFESFRTKMKSL
ncbi:MAG: nucleotidyltransferase substrate binding protein [Cryomorphaceae bacterium]|nr:nucleotidyltransferase substrate binding protein [Flavobacteriales bacterium]